MKKALIAASVASMIDLFNRNNIKILQSLGYEVHVACNFENGSITSQEKVDECREELNRSGIKTYHIPIPRKIMAIKDIFASYKAMEELVKQNNYELVHCHSPIGGVVTRLACRKNRQLGTNVIYTAHGFHFYTGAPLISWLTFYPIEKYCSKFTDVLITINDEDYIRAEKKFKMKKVEYVPGIGIDTDKIDCLVVDKNLKREQIGIPEEAFILFSVGELNKNKNHETVIRALASIKNTDIHYVICGEGGLEEELKKLSLELNIDKQVHFLGYRKDVLEIYKIVDLFVFPSQREGLSVSLMEAMASGLPVVCSKIRGNIDLIQDKSGGALVSVSDLDNYIFQIRDVYMNRDKLMRYGEFNKKYIQKFSINVVTERMRDIYSVI